ncbi:hypothetical protein ACIRU3_44160 [Streptomyces sp. NPDC101151]|uniref:hypothetical protein n=1 Tax=Streptomyces sp. NPDC101151 TaxID=3366115 RepID=UPI00381314DA
MTRVQRHEVTALAPHGIHPFEPGIPARILGAADDRHGVVDHSTDGRPVETNAGISLTPQQGPDVLDSADTVIPARPTPHGSPRNRPARS